MVPLPWEHAMKKFILMTLVAATSLSPVAGYAAEIAPQTGSAASTFSYNAGFQQEDPRTDDQADRPRRTPEQRAERRAERQQNRIEGTQQVQAEAPRQAPVREYRPREEMRPDRQRDGARTDDIQAERQREVIRNNQQRNGARMDGVGTQQREASQDGRYYDRNRDGNLDRRWDQNRDGNLDRNWDRNRDGRLDRRLDRNDDERIDRRYDRNRNGELDRRVDRNNDNRVDRQQPGRWTNGWRNDNRYDWRSHRERNRNYYRPGRYYSPYRDRNYSRISIGFSIGSAYYGSRYWINDPWQYRLPAAYGPYRWVRYYDDVLLIDLRNGRVVDVIRDFFW